MSSGLAQLRQQRLSVEEKNVFKSEMQKRQKTVGNAYIMWFFLGLHYAYLGLWPLQLFYWACAISMFFTGGVLALVFIPWAILDLFRMPKLVERGNEKIAEGVTAQISALR